LANEIAKTPLMLQYNAIKGTYPDAILLFRVGDFYETFSTDAIKTSEILGIALTRRANGSATFVELAGFPYHALDTYLPKLVRAGQRVAICDQLEDPKLTKTIVKRGVTELVTPGVAMGDNVLEHKENNYLACINIQKEKTGIAFLDISTGEFFMSEGSSEYVDKLLNSFNPKEVLHERSKHKKYIDTFGNRYYNYPLEDWVFTDENAKNRLIKQFDTLSLKGFGVEGYDFGITAAGAILQYLDLTHHEKIKHITKISRIEEERYVWLDKFSIRNLELIYPIHPEGKTLIDILDRTATPMGGRLLKRWIALPLKDIEPIQRRLSMVEFMLNNKDFGKNLHTNIKEMGDLERIASKVALLRVNPRDLIQLKNSLALIEPLKQMCENSGEENLKAIAEQLNSCDTLKKRIAKELNAEPPNQINKGNVIASNVSDELDELREITTSGKDYLLKMQNKMVIHTGINSLKIGFNNVFGYYFEVRNTFKDKVPQEWIRKQTLVGAERYINEELKQYEAKILGAEEKILDIEAKLFNNLVSAASEYIAILQHNASLIARLDVLHSFADVAAQFNYSKPDVNDSLVIDIKDGRHPVIEKQLQAGDQYIANDIYLDDGKNQIIIITGPNMAGKSALLRQTALIVLMAQLGSYVPANAASIGIVDKIFTRVGASDNIALGESTFMVEMNEAASILNNLSNRSLILFDELGRGTSTYDGISIAWAIVEFIISQHVAKAKTLFATHYHELNEMEKMYEGIKNFNVSVKEVGNKVIFLRKLVRGGSEHSFGIHVAQMAGMPKKVIDRANEILIDMEESHDKTWDKNNEKIDSTLHQKEQINWKNRKKNASKSSDGAYQLSFYQLDDPVLSQIRDEILTLNINNLTPIEALNKLNEIKKIIGK